jgi:hypothetical protein
MTADYPTYIMVRVRTGETKPLEDINLEEALDALRTAVVEIDMLRHQIEATDERSGFTRKARERSRK